MEEPENCRSGQCIATANAHGCIMGPLPTVDSEAGLGASDNRGETSLIIGNISDLLLRVETQLPELVLRGYAVAVPTAQSIVAVEESAKLGGVTREMGAISFI
jgi:hypothetical protein